jgi:hypothetical protein
MKMEKRFRPLGIEGSSGSGMVSDFVGVVSIWSDKWRDRECEAENMGGGPWKWTSMTGGPPTTPREISDALIAAKLRATHTKCKCSAAWWHLGGARARPVRRYLGASAGESTEILLVLRDCFQGARKAHVAAIVQPPNHPHVWL